MRMRAYSAKSRKPPAASYIARNATQKSALVLSAVPLLFVLLTTRTPSSSTTVGMRSAPLDAAIKKPRSGGTGSGGWTLVDWTNPFADEEESSFNCEYTPFVSSSSGREASMCVHSFPDFVSGYVRDKKRWEECDILPHMWNASQPDENSLYLDIGTNIGSCVMEMLLGTTANIIAFESHPLNVYALKKSISKLDKSYHDRVRLFPIGLYVERLDSVLNLDGRTVKLSKMDVEGFECNVLEGWGIGKLAERIEVVKFEYSRHRLAPQGCKGLLTTFNNYGYHLFKQYSASSNTYTDPIPENAEKDGIAVPENGIFAKRTMTS